MSAPMARRDYFSMGSRCCIACGQWIPSEHDMPRSGSAAAGGLQCRRCNVVQPERPMPDFEKASEVTTAALLFTKAEIDAAWKSVKHSLEEARREDVGVAQTDNRVEEEAFCEKCGVPRKCKVFARQIRSADEGQTVFYQCTSCDSEWQLNS
ncbi:DNA-directed RNA polymerase I subunit, putative [Trypanosoma equiperdum]|uniref:DNA-directed RNA polymerase, putative n=5 Tax=Trypanozoon TaxID=39700 RepID=Q383N7_TRYB2|nr:DNA-directed RNA polymerase, putative [Trypanosoma brucei gambiense DAL972]XP_829106.1 DNA-directed RNA polymerase, putative [Trypanosoma brucei brucei TREU927]RHW67919.1 DNA-directed RNA polymerase I subunit [Trypanosoma brucei equiperdum]CAJ43706.1 RNA polymerase I subunit RPA12 [Trypanosoma brucei brucei]SCU72788.1 DNA-directed RNA polymerase I subunit, putative [Trypanosoma equiperdum]EAN79994.1 DNA-directed RNA polymerase, putative [Trypanosoma brucei brucei TREU927]CBH18049.1 DNA-dir|eukprot:XP_011780313.1 DNA-directed RNA polymerase, putative [Trypanosoma brucei gambiense DAL972]